MAAKADMLPLGAEGIPYNGLEFVRSLLSYVSGQCGIWRPHCSPLCKPLAQFH